jgi:DNA-binding NarL/FixJ family response regulator
MPSPRKKAAAAKAPPKLRVLIVDDHPLFRQGVRALIDHEPDLMCCAEADSVSTAFANITACHPQVVLLDLRLRHDDGMEVIQWLKTQPRLHAIRVLVMSQATESLCVQRAMEAGAAGYIVKEEASEELLTAIRAVSAGELYLSRKMSAGLLRELFDGNRSRASHGLRSLSNRELQVLRLLGQGQSTREAAAQLKLSFKTIETHRENIKHKLGLADAAELIAHATRWVLRESKTGPPGG